MSTHASGKRKEAIARATIRKGTGKIRINKKLLETIQPEHIRLKIKEPMMLIPSISSKIDVDVNVMGGGQSSQADAVRLAIARGIVDFSKDKKIEKMFLDYDRNMLVADVRRKEVNKPGRSKARAKRQKSYR